MQMKKGATNRGRNIQKHSPGILTCIGVAGVIGTAIFAVKATPKAMDIIKKEEKRRNAEGNSNPLRSHEIVRLTWKCYIPAGSIALASCACIIGATQIGLRRQAALVSAYSLTEAAFREYKTKVIETIGRNKEIKVRDEISSDHIQTNPPSPNEVIITGKGEVLCYDSLSGRYFKSDMESIRRIVNDFNRQLIHEDWAMLNDLYWMLGLASTVLGETLGWHVDKGEFTINYSAVLTPGGEPCMCLNYDVMPRYML